MTSFFTAKSCVPCNSIALSPGSLQVDVSLESDLSGRARRASTLADHIHETADQLRCVGVHFIIESMPAVGIDPPIMDPSVDMPFLSMLKFFVRLAKHSQSDEVRSALRARHVVCASPNLQNFASGSPSSGPMAPSTAERGTRSQALAGWALGVGAPPPLSRRHRRAV